MAVALARDDFFSGIKGAERLVAVPFFCVAHVLAGLCEAFEIFFNEFRERIDEREKK